MHYFIDGYNMLFRLIDENNDLQSQRESFIHELNVKVSVVKIDVSIVFDASYQIDDRSRSHFDALEIIFSAKGETADEYIIEQLKNHPSPHQETVVTSDKNLAWQTRHCSAHTMTVEKFHQWLNKHYKNKIAQIKKRKKNVTTCHEYSQTLISHPPDEAPLETYTEYYQQVFESKWQKLVFKEEKEKEQKTPSLKSKKSRRKSQITDPFKIIHPSIEEEVDEMQRWLKIFENRDKEIDL